jgi:hypothetical protein
MTLHWTTRSVEAKLCEAADTVRCLPEVRVRGYFNTWPAVIRDRFELSGFAEGPTRPAPASPRAVTEMEMTLLWLRELDPEEQKIVWARANRRPWKAIAHEHGVERTTLWRRWKMAIAVIAARLNASNVATLLQHRAVQQICPNQLA